MTSLSIERFEKAKRRIKIGGWIGVVVGLLPLLFILWAARGDPTAISERDAFLGDPSTLLDVVFTVGLAIGVLRRSRICAVLLTVFYLWSRLIFGFLGFGSALNLISLLVLFFFLRATIATFVYHRHLRAQAPDAPRPRRRLWLWIGLGAPISAVVVPLMIYGLFSATGHAPPIDVVSGERLAERQRAELVALGVTRADEDVLYFYSEGFLSIAEGGSVLTTKRIIAYEPGFGADLRVYSLPLSEVGHVVEITPGGFAEDAVYMVRDRSGDERFILLLSTGSDGHLRFVNRLRALSPEPPAGPPPSNGRGVS